MQCALAKAEDARLRARERELLAGFHGKPDDVYDRGFLVHARFMLTKLVDEGAAIFAKHPLLRSLEIDDVATWLTVAETPEAGWETVAGWLERAFATFPPDRITALAAQPCLIESVGEDSTYRHRCGTEFLDFVRRTTKLGALKELRIDDAGYAANRLTGLADSFPRLDTLRLSNSAMPWTTAADVVNENPCILHLGYRVSGWFSDDIASFLERVEPGRLRGFELSTRNPNEAITQFGAFPNAVAAIEELRLVQLGEPISRASAEALTRMPALKRIEVDEPTRVFAGLPFAVRVNRRQPSR